MHIISNLQSWIATAATAAGFPATASDVAIDQPRDPAHGDFSCNFAMQIAKYVGRSPKEVAAMLVDQLNQNPIEDVASTNLAGPGFINIFVSKDFLVNSLKSILNDDHHKGEKYLNVKAPKKVMFEYTDPNPFKQFHIGHLMTNTIGESLARLHDWAGSDVVRANYQGDVGRHVARSLWGMLNLGQEMPADTEPLSKRTAFLGKAYVLGATDDDKKTNPAKFAEVNALNKAVYLKADPDINTMYDKGRSWSLEHFEKIYKKLGTKFDHYFFESETANAGMEVVANQTEAGVFETSNGAIVYKGEQDGLHTRVFINSEGLPTYETKEIGLSLAKFSVEPDVDFSYVITANEQQEYMKVVLAALAKFEPEKAAKARHLVHGMMQGPGGKKMSSRKGDVITGEGLLEEVETIASEKIKETDRNISNPKQLASQIAVGAIKFGILKQQLGKNIIFDYDQALSFEGDSGPYLQYTYARTQSILTKARESGFITDAEGDFEPILLDRMLFKFPLTTARAYHENSPHHIVTYLLELTREFNSWYAKTQIVDRHNPQFGHNLALTRAVGKILYTGLNLLGIVAPKKM